MNNILTIIEILLVFSLAMHVRALRTIYFSAESDSTTNSVSQFKRPLPQNSEGGDAAYMVKTNQDMVDTTCSTSGASTSKTKTTKSNPRKRKNSAEKSANPQALDDEEAQLNEAIRISMEQSMEEGELRKLEEEEMNKAIKASMGIINCEHMTDISNELTDITSSSETVSSQSCISSTPIRSMCFENNSTNDSYLNLDSTIDTSVFAAEASSSGYEKLNSTDFEQSTSKGEKRKKTDRKAIFNEVINLSDSNCDTSTIKNGGDIATNQNRKRRPLKYNGLQEDSSDEFTEDDITSTRKNLRNKTKIINKRGISIDSDTDESEEFHSCSDMIPDNSSIISGNDSSLMVLEKDSKVSKEAQYSKYNMEEQKNHDSFRNVEHVFRRVMKRRVTEGYSCLYILNLLIFRTHQNYGTASES